MKTTMPLVYPDFPGTEPTPQVLLPAATKREIAVRAVESGETIRVVVLCALDAYRSHVLKEALVNRRKSQ